MDGEMRCKGVYFREVAPGDIEYVAAHMRKADRIEIKRWNGSTPEYELRRSIELSDVAQVGVFDDGEIACIFGGKRTNVMDSIGCVWSLSTEAVDRHRVAFARGSKVGLDLVMKSLPDVQEFENYVDAEYSSAIRWIEWLGGDIALRDRALGRFGGNFLKFYFINPYYKED